MARWGVSKTTVADIAAAAGCSRATVYRTFPGGKQQIVESIGRAELDTFFDLLADRIAAHDNLEDALVDVIATAVQVLDAHEAFQLMLEQEPGLVLPFLGFNRIDRLYDLVRQRLAPQLEPYIGARADWAIEWAARVALSYVFQPSPSLDLSDPSDVRRLVRSYLLPGLTPRFATIPA